MGKKFLKKVKKVVKKIAQVKINVDVKPDATKITVGPGQGISVTMTF